MEDCAKTKRIVAFCVDGINDLRDTPPMGILWDRRWASLLALVRTASEVLEMDAPIYWQAYMEKPNVGHKGRDAKKRWQPPIFGKFIWTDANLFLHQGRTHEDEAMMPHTPPMGMYAAQLTPMPPPDAERGPPTRQTDLEPPYCGRNSVEVAREAVDWLEAQIKIAENSE
jgi:hypothetical protein